MTDSDTIESPDKTYKIIGLVGKGSFGNVYKAIEIGTNHPVALKVINNFAISDNEQNDPL